MFKEGITMKKKTIVLATMGTVIFSGCFTVCTSVSVGAGYLTPVVKPPSFEDFPYGGLAIGASFDSTYTRFVVDIYPGIQETYPEPANPPSSSYTFFGKYPIELGRITTYPLVGYGLPFGLTAGAGIDVSLAEIFALRGEAVYGFGGYTNDIGETGALSVRAGIVWVFNAGGVSVHREFEDKNLAVKDHAKIMLSSYVRIADIDSKRTDIQKTGFPDTWLVIPPGVHILLGFRMSSVDSQALYPERSGREITGGEDYIYTFRSMDVDENGLQDTWMGTVLLEKGHYYMLYFRNDGLVPTLLDITKASSFSDERQKINKTLKIK
jgi:hypothetical protein